MALFKINITPGEVELRAGPHASMHRNQEGFQIMGPISLNYVNEALLLLFAHIADNLVVFRFALDSRRRVQGDLSIVHPDAKDERECGLIAVAGCWRPLFFVHLIKQPRLDIALGDHPCDTIVEVRADEAQFDGEIVLCPLAISLPRVKERVFCEFGEGDIFSDGVFRQFLRQEFFMQPLRQQVDRVAMPADSLLVPLAICPGVSDTPFPRIRNFLEDPSLPHSLFRWFLSWFLGRSFDRLVILFHVPFFLEQSLRSGTRRHNSTTFATSITEWKLLLTSCELRHCSITATAI